MINMSENINEYDAVYCEKCDVELESDECDVGICYICSRPYDDEDDLIDGVGFSDPGGRSALRAETETNPRIHPCPQCNRKNVLTTLDVSHKYVCDICADRNESGGW